MIAVFGETYDSLLGLRKIMDGGVSRDEPSLVLDLPIFKGRIQGHEVICVTSGTTNYLSLASALLTIEKYHPSEAFVLGETSALSPLLHLGDIVIGNRIFIHGVNFHSQGLPYGTIPGFQPFIYSSIDLARTMESLSSSMSDISLMRGDIISGEKKIVDQEEFVSLVLRRYAGKNHLCGYDCNSGGVAIACEMKKIPFLPLRAVTYIPYEGEDGQLMERRMSLVGNASVATLLRAYLGIRSEGND